MILACRMLEWFGLTRPADVFRISGSQVVKTKSRYLTGVLTLVGLLPMPVVIPSCSDSNFKSEAAAPKQPSAGGNQSPVEDGNNPQPANTPEPGFAKAGKSLDLYVIMDKSGSLYVDPTTQKMGSGSDVECKRFDALLQLVDSLKTKLNSNEQVRLTVVTFSKDAQPLGSLDQVLSLQRQQIIEKFRAGVCDNPDYDTTNYERGISSALQSHSANTNRKKLDLESVVFFSDGAARDTDSRKLEEAVTQLNTRFQGRIYGVLLGRTQDKCVLKDAATGRSLQTGECMLKVVGNAPARLLSVDDAGELAAAWADLVNK
jgi:hypothetical protein